jgi:RNA polymerase sigma-70 factor, ECF subfamily
LRHRDLAAQLAPLLGELTRFARWLTTATDEADEVVQETLIRALRSGASGIAVTDLRAWLFKIARNARVDLLRKNARRERLVVLEGGIADLEAFETAPPVLPALLDEADLVRALAQLSEASRAALLLTDLWEFDHVEVAQILELPLGTVKSRVARARAKVAAILADGTTSAAKGGRA